MNVKETCDTEQENISNFRVLENGKIVEIILDANARGELVGIRLLGSIGQALHVVSVPRQEERRGREKRNDGEDRSAKR